MSFLYPRIVSIHRPTAQVGVGVRPYSGLTPSAESVVATGLPASIQQKSQRQRNTPEGLPADSSVMNGWHIFLPKRAAALGLILARDIVIDDAGLRYSVFGPYWNSLGYNLLVELEQV